MNSLNRRKKLKFEPFYDPDISLDLGAFENGRWGALSNSLQFRKIFNLSFAHSDIGVETSRTIVLKNVHFLECDFRDILPDLGRIVFLSCQFEKCDFAKSWLMNTKFSNCRFYKTSFSLCDMRDAHFKECMYEMIGFSGSETIASETYIDDPESFVDALMIPAGEQGGWLSLKASNDLDRFYATKSVMARSLMNSLKTVGSESEFYKGVKTHEIAQSTSRFVRRVHNRQYLKGSYYFLDVILISILGELNSWGKNPLKPLFILIGLCAAFSIVYWVMFEELTFEASLSKSVNISIVVGYAVEANASEGFWMRLLQTIQAICSIVVYTTFVGSIFGRVTRLR